MVFICDFICFIRFVITHLEPKKKWYTLINSKCCITCVISYFTCYTFCFSIVDIAEVNKIGTIKNIFYQVIKWIHFTAFFLVSVLVFFVEITLASYLSSQPFDKQNMVSAWLLSTSMISPSRLSFPNATIFFLNRNFIFFPSLFLYFLSSSSNKKGRFHTAPKNRRMFLFVVTVRQKHALRIHLD